jgi:hypothetical protein
MNRRIIPTMLLVLAMVLPAGVARAEVDWADTSIQDQPTTTSSYETAANDSETQGEVGALETPSDLADGGFTDTLDSSDGTCDPRRNPCESSMTTSSSSSEGGTASASGCRTVDAWKNHYTLFRTLAYRFHHTKRWCWSSNRITSVSTSTYISHVQTCCQDYEGVINSAGYYYNYFSNISKSGHYSMRQGKFRNCLLRYGCISTTYPWVKIYAHGNGTWNSYRGG